MSYDVQVQNANIPFENVCAESFGVNHIYGANADTIVKGLEKMFPLFCFEFNWDCACVEFFLNKAEFNKETCGTSENNKFDVVVDSVKNVVNEFELENVVVVDENSQEASISY